MYFLYVYVICNTALLNAYSFSIAYWSLGRLAELGRHPCSAKHTKLCGASTFLANIDRTLNAAGQAIIKSCQFVYV